MIFKPSSISNVNGKRRWLEVDCVQYRLEEIFEPRRKSQTNNLLLERRSCEVEHTRQWSKELKVAVLREGREEHEDVAGMEIFARREEHEDVTGMEIFAQSLFWWIH